MIEAQKKPHNYCGFCQYWGKDKSGRMHCEQREMLQMQISRSPVARQRKNCRCYKAKEYGKKV